MTGGAPRNSILVLCGFLRSCQAISMLFSRDLTFDILTAIMQVYFKRIHRKWFVIIKIQCGYGIRYICSYPVCDEVVLTYRFELKIKFMFCPAPQKLLPSVLDNFIKIAFFLLSYSKFGCHLCYLKSQIMRKGKDLFWS